MEMMIKGHVYIGVDFDGTITTERDDSFGVYKLQPHCKEVLLELYSTGKVHFALWTCRTGKQLETAKDFLKEEGLLHIFEGINESFPEIDSLFSEPSGRKLSCDFYIDDRMLLGKIDWVAFESEIKKYI